MPWIGKEYKCYLASSCGTSITIGIPKFPKEKIDPIDVEHGDAMVLHCNPPKGIPPLHIYWMNIGKYLSFPPDIITNGISLQKYFYNLNLIKIACGW